MTEGRSMSEFRANQSEHAQEAQDYPRDLGLTKQQSLSMSDSERLPKGIVLRIKAQLSPGGSACGHKGLLCVWRLFWSMLPMRLSLDSVDTTDCGDAIERRQEHLHRESRSHSGCLRASAKTSLSGFPAQASLYPSPPGVTHIWSGCLKTQVPRDPWELPGPK